MNIYTTGNLKNNLHEKQPTRFNKAFNVAKMVNMHTCYVIDDESYAVATLENHIKKIPELILIGSHTNPLLALEDINDGNRPDLVFLDINMPELSGLAVADLLPAGIAIIFTTAHAKYALNAFEKGAEDFLLKPFSFEKFVKAVTKVKAKLRAEKLANLGSSESIFINPGIKGKIVQINIAEITHIEALDYAVGIYTLHEKQITKLSMATIQAKLSPIHFVRVHRSYLVKVDQIKSIDSNQIILYNNISIPLGEAYKNNLMAHIRHKTIKYL